MTDSSRTFHRIAVIGAGAWGTALAAHLARKSLSVTLWAHEPEVAQSIRSERENRLFLPGFILPGTLTATHSLAEALEGTEVLVFAVPSHAARSVLSRIGEGGHPARPVISATKGIEEGSFELMSEVVTRGWLRDHPDLLTVLSGPSFAGEVAKELPTAVALAGSDRDLVRDLQTMLMTSRFRVYGSSDVVGVQLGGALKNVMALAAGVVDGLGLGHNARAALITRGLAEIIRLGQAMGADPRTFYGLSGVGDLVLTSTGPASRNHQVGLRLGQGERLADILDGMQAVAEGVRTAGAALGLARRHQVDMPIVREVCAVLFEGKSCSRAVSDLMERGAKEEVVC
ncbi:MAG: NAD(P)H-dependent glycerol-3-phosphate dehydrogenase [Nitrospiraceae bacterium]